LNKEQDASARVVRSENILLWLYVCDCTSERKWLTSENRGRRGERERKPRTLNDQVVNGGSAH